MNKINDQIKEIISDHYNFDSLFKRDYKIIKKVFKEILSNNLLHYAESFYISCDESSLYRDMFTLIISIKPPEYHYTPFSEHKSGWIYDNNIFSISINKNHIEEFYFFGDKGDYVHYTWKVILN